MTMSMKHSFASKLVIAGPPLLLVIIGLAVYIAVIKIVTPEEKVISVVEDGSEVTPLPTITPTPLASSSAQLSIPSEVILPNQAELETMQREADEGVHTWRLDPLQTAEQTAGQYGFLVDDQLTLLTDEAARLEGRATVLVHHNGSLYELQMQQPVRVGADGVWIIAGVAKQATSTM